MPNIEVNTATTAMLQSVPGLGPVLADRIVQERVAHGPYEDASDLASRVEGLGLREVERLEAQGLIIDDAAAMGKLDKDATPRERLSTIRPSGSHDAWPGPLESDSSVELPLSARGCWGLRLPKPICSSCCQININGKPRDAMEAARSRHRTSISLRPGPFASTAHTARRRCASPREGR